MLSIAVIKRKVGQKEAGETEARKPVEIAREAATIAPEKVSKNNGKIQGAKKKSKRATIKLTRKAHS